MPLAWVKPAGSILLLLLGFLCLGRAVETGLDHNPDRIGKRETITAGLLLGLPATAGGVGLAVSARRDGRRPVPRDHRRRLAAQHLRTVFFQLAKAGRGKVTALRFAMEAGISGDRATAYLSERAREYDATFQVDNEGGITYCFNLGEVDSRLLRPAPVNRFDVVLEAVPPAKQRDIMRTVQHLTGLDWKAVKALVRTLPQPIQTGASQTTAEEFKRSLEAVGAQVLVVLRTE